MKIKSINKFNVVNFVNDIKLNKKVAAILASSYTDDVLKKIIVEGRLDKLQELKGIGPKTAKVIVEEGRKYLHNDADFKMTHYSAPIYDFVNMLDDFESSKISKIQGSEDPNEIMNELDDLCKYEQERKNMPLVARKAPQLISLPHSIMADILNIAENDVTDKICIYKHGAEDLCTISSTVLYKLCNRDQSREIRHILEVIRKLFVTRAVEHGFINADGVPYSFYTSSPGQLKKASGYWMRSDVLNSNKKLFWGGLTPRIINKNLGKKRIPMTKILQYRALLCSAAMPSSVVFGRKISVNNMICIGEYEKNMTAKVMSVSEEYKVTEGMRGDIANNMFDGWFALNERVYGKVIMQSRVYGIKGLGVSFDWEGYSIVKGYDKSEKCYVIEDVDGVVHDLRKEPDKNIIVNTSVFKMLKMFGSWKNYVQTMNELGLDELYVCAIDEDKVEEKRISRQMMQSLCDIDEDEIDHLSRLNLGTLNKFSDLEEATKIMSEEGKPYWKRSNIGKLISAYPEALKLDSMQKELRDRYVSMYNHTMCGELSVNGRYFFAVSDPCAWADIVFGKKDINDPSIGYLKAGECRCTGFPMAKNLIALRSPHAFMEWATLRNTPACCWLSDNAIYFSVHDLTYRVLQMDFDGDHILVVNDQRLFNLVNKIKQKYEIPVLYYEPSKGGDTPEMPLRSHEFCEQIVHCIMKCLEYNKVGEYSNYVTAAWSTFDPNMTKEQFKALMKDIAIIAAGINHAVDAQKTFALNPLSKEIRDAYRFKPFSERYRHANPIHPNNDPYWDEITRDPSNGSVDRLSEYVDSIVPDHLEIDVSSLNFNWDMMLDHDPKYNMMIRRTAVNAEILQNLIAYDVDNTKASTNYTLDKAKNGIDISMVDFYQLISRQNSAFFESLKENEDDAVQVAWTNNDRIAMIRSMMVSFTRQGTPGVANMSDEEVERVIAAYLLKNVFRNERNMRYARFIFDIFGDIYAETVLKNVAANYVPVSQDELDYEDANAFEAPFDPNMFEVPEEQEADYEYDSFMYNGMFDM